MKVAIIGAGKMGSWFAKFFFEQGAKVVVSDRDAEKLSKIAKELNVETASNVNAVKNADRILICVPVENFEDVVAEISPYIRREQEVMDICSVKEVPVNIMHKYIRNRVTLGTHPLFGPGVKSIEKQNFVLTPTNSRENKLAEEFGGWLESRGAKVFVMAPREHDELMCIVLGLPYFLSLVVCDTIISHGRFLEARKVSGISYKFLLTLVEAILSEEADFSASLQLNLPEAYNIGELLSEKVKEWLNLVKQKDRFSLVNKINVLKSYLVKINPDYPRSYEIMHRMLETLKNYRNS